MGDDQSLEVLRLNATSEVIRMRKFNVEDGVANMIAAIDRQFPAPKRAPKVENPLIVPPSPEVVDYARRMQQQRAELDAGRLQEIQANIDAAYYNHEDIDNGLQQVA